MRPARDLSDAELRTEVGLFSDLGPLDDAEDVARGEELRGLQEQRQLAALRKAQACACAGPCQLPSAASPGASSWCRVPWGCPDGRIALGWTGPYKWVPCSIGVPELFGGAARTRTGGARLVAPASFRPAPFWHHWYAHQQELAQRRLPLRPLQMARPRTLPLQRQRATNNQ
jgi:hypothetical protein